MQKYFLLCLLFCSTYSYAQKSKFYNEYKKAVSFNFFALAQLDYTILPGVEFNLTPRVLFGGEVGYIFASSYLNDNNGGARRASGFIIRPAIKYFTDDRNRYYLQPQLFYKQVTHQVYDWLGKEVVNGVATYEQLQNFKYRRKTIGFNAIVGRMIQLSRGRTYFDFYLGLGIRSKSSLVVGEPASRYQRLAIIGNQNMDEGIYPGFPAGLRVIYKLD